MNRYHFTFSVVFIIFLFGCKSAKTLSSGNASFDLSAKQLIKKNTKQKANFKTLVARVKFDYTQGTQSKGATISLRMEKDKTIWMSKFGFVKVLITPNRVSFYNKLDNTYFDGNYEYLSDLLGTALDFEKVQNLLLGEALYSLQDESYDISVHEGSYLLQPKKQPDIFEIFYLLNPSHFKLDAQQLAQPKAMRLLEIDYTSYQDVEKQIFPEKIKINAVEAETETIIELEIKSISLNENIRFPFKIPSGFKEIVF